MTGGQPAAQNMPEAEVDVTDQLVRGLLAAQTPELARRTLVEVANGWDNVIFRLGDDLAVRVPRREMAADLIVAEQVWLPLVAPALPLAVPVPVHAGTPTDDYPWHWSITPWFNGRPLGTDPPLDQNAAAEQLAGFANALHRPLDAYSTNLSMHPNKARRGAPLAELDERFWMWVDRMGGALPDSVGPIWRDLASAEPWDGPPVLIHGDLHGLNTLVEHDRISAVIDFGDIGVGDPATDIAGVWTMLDPPALDVLRSELAPKGGPVDADTWARSTAWALYFAVIYLANSANHPTLNTMGHRTLARVIEAVDGS